jgi:hypothetical protein
VASEKVGYGLQRKPEPVVQPGGLFGDKGNKPSKDNLEEE